MLYIYNKKLSEDARKIASALDGTLVRKFDGINLWRKGKRITLTKEDSILCWGNSLPELDECHVINPGTRDLTWPQISSRIIYRAHRAVDTFTAEKTARYNHVFGRRFDAQDGEDIIDYYSGGPATNKWDYYTRKYDFESEIILHIFAGKVIKTGKKVPIEGLIEVDHPTWIDKNYYSKDIKYYHPWIKTRLGGWKTTFQDIASGSSDRTLAKSALDILGRKFGVVTIGVSGGQRYVLSVDQVPKLDDPSVLESWLAAYKKFGGDRGVNAGAKEREVLDNTGKVQPAPPKVIAIAVNAAGDCWIMVNSNKKLCRIDRTHYEYLSFSTAIAPWDEVLRYSSNPEEAINRAPIVPMDQVDGPPHDVPNNNYVVGNNDEIRPRYFDNPVAFAANPMPIPAPQDDPIRVAWNNIFPPNNQPRRNARVGRGQVAVEPVRAVPVEGAIYNAGIGVINREMVAMELHRLENMVPWGFEDEPEREE